MLAMLLSRVLFRCVMVMVDDGSDGCCDVVVSLTSEDNDIYVEEPLYIQVHALL
jgi:hypothetical protein